MAGSGRGAWVAHAVLIAGLALVLFPIYVAFVASSLTLRDILECPDDAASGSAPRRQLSRGADCRHDEDQRRKRSAAMMGNSLVMALAIAIGKIAISLPSAYAVVFFRFPLRRLCFWAIFVTLMLPVEVRIIPTYKIAADLRLDRHLCRAGPAADRLGDSDIAVPPVLSDYPRRARSRRPRSTAPVRCAFSVDTVIPLSRTNIAALFVILFIYGWNQYLWPLLITDTPTMTTIIIGIRQMIGNGDAQTEWQIVMATALLAILPPVAVVLLMQRWFVAGLIEPEK